MKCLRSLGTTVPDGISRNTFKNNFRTINMTKPLNGATETVTTGRSELENTIIDAIQNRKGVRIVDMDFSGLDTAPARTFIVCQGNSTSQVAAIADNIREEVRERLDIKPYNYDGYRNAQWIVIDYGDLMVHVFQPEVREFYNIEDLWSDARIELIPDLD